MVLAQYWCVTALDSVFFSVAVPPAAGSGGAGGMAVNDTCWVGSEFAECLT